MNYQPVEPLFTHRYIQIVRDLPVSFVVNKNWRKSTQSCFSKVFFKPLKHAQ